MWTFEVAIGVLILAAAATTGFGLLAALLPLMPSGLGVAMPFAGLGAALIAGGMARLEEQRGGESGAQIWRAIAYTSTAALLTTGLPLVSDILDLVSVAGFPLGYYTAAQGLLVLLAILAFRAAITLELPASRGPVPPTREEP